MAPVPKVELYAAIRRDARAGMSARAIGRKYRVGRRTIIKALASAWPEPRKKPPRRASKLDPFKPAIDEMLRADLDAPRKQRHTITRTYRRLIEEHQMRDVSYPVVRAYVAERRPQIRAEAGRDPAEVFVPQSHRPGAEAEVDFGEVAVRLAGEQVSCFLFCLRLSFSGKAVHRVSLSGGQEAFFEGHEHAFRLLGGVPAGKVRYDNLKAAVAQVLGSAVPGWKTSDGPRSGHTITWTPSTASPASRVPTRKAEWKGRSAGSAATIWSRCPTCSRSRRSTR
jgi:transposase